MRQGADVLRWLALARHALADDLTTGDTGNDWNKQNRLG